MAKGSFLVSQAAARVLIEQGLGGDIVYISSKNSIFAGPNNIAYGAAKADQAHQVRLLAAELGEHGIKVNGVNPDGVVQGSGIFASGWGANRAAVYGVEEKDLGKFYAQRTILKREVLPGEHRQRGLRALRPRPAEPHHRAAHPRRRRRRGGLPAMTTAAPRRRRPRGDQRPGDGRRASGRGTLALEEVHRFPNGGVPVGGSLSGTCSASTARCSPVSARWRAPGRSHGIGIDSWAVDYGLLDRDGELLGNPYSHRDPRTARRARAWSPDGRAPQELYAVNGLQQLPFNTVYQLAAARGTAALERPTRCCCCPTCSATG